MIIRVEHKTEKILGVALGSLAAFLLVPKAFQMVVRALGRLG